MALSPDWYYRIKYSLPGRWYTALRHPALRRQRQQSRQYYGALLQQYSSGKPTGAAKGLVFDIGANTGELTEVFRQLGFVVVAAEPDPVNYAQLQYRFRGVAGVTVIPSALAAEEGEQEFYSAEAHGHCLSTLSTRRRDQLQGTEDEEGLIQFSTIHTVPTTTLAALVHQYGQPQFIKIDVEGYEREVLQGLHVPVPLLSFEANLPGFLTDTLDCLDQLHRLDESAQFNCSANDQNLLNPQWMPYETFQAWLRERKENYLEIWCRGEEPA